jgi:hypothetical protein
LPLLPLDLKPLSCHPYRLASLPHSNPFSSKLTGDRKKRGAHRNPNSGVLVCWRRRRSTHLADAKPVAALPPELWKMLEVEDDLAGT